jgi:hypothetical protein
MQPTRGMLRKNYRVARQMLLRQTPLPGRGLDAWPAADARIFECR